MESFDFEKQGVHFYFRNPTWDTLCKNLMMEWKIAGIRENSQNDGYLFSSTFLCEMNAMSVCAKIGQRQINGVTLPENILKEVKALYAEYKEADLQKRLNSQLPHA